jgi:hypothetical protein
MQKNIGEVKVVQRIDYNSPDISEPIGQLHSA